MDFFLLLLVFYYYFTIILLLLFIIIPIISTTYTFYLIRVIKNNQKVANDDNVMKNLYFTQFIKALCTTHMLLYLSYTRNIYAKM